MKDLVYRLTPVNLAVTGLFFGLGLIIGVFVVA